MSAGSWRPGASVGRACLTARLLAALLLVGRTGAWTLASGDRLHAGVRVATSSPRERPSVLDLERAEEWCTANGLQPMHLNAVYRTLFREGRSLEPLALAAAGLPAARARELCDVFTPCAARVVETRHSAGGGRKLLVELGSGERVETVLIRHEHRSSGRARHTVCVSSQSGCSRRCSFCATGSMGLRAQLSSADILEQVWLARELIASDAAAERAAGRADFADAPLRNIVFMGMGEPLDNLDAVLRACRALTHMSLFALSPKQITVSTVGASAAAIVRLGHAAPSVRLALSLHAASQGLREALLPSARDCDVDALAAALDEHAALSGTGAMLEYLLIAGTNDSEADADALAAFCAARSQAAAAAAAPLNGSGDRGDYGDGGGDHSGRERKTHGAFVNLIPYNPTAPGALHGYQTPSDAAVEAFHAALRSRGVNALVRWTSAAGRDADGACGQLALGGDGAPAVRAGAARGAVRMCAPDERVADDDEAGGRGELPRPPKPASRGAQSAAATARRQLEGVKLQAMVEELHARMGWGVLAAELGVRCLEPEARPTVKSALKFLRAPEHKWARDRCERLYLEMKMADQKLGRLARWGGGAAGGGERY